MTYCVAVTLDAGMVFASDTRTNAGVDNIASFRKMYIFSEDGNRVIVMLTAGNLSMVAVNAGTGLPVRELAGAAFRPLQLVTALATGLMVMAITVPPVRDLMKFAIPSAGALAGVLAAVAVVSALAWWLQPRRL